MQGGHQSQEEWAHRQFRQARVAANRVVEQQRLPLDVVDGETTRWSYMGIPSIDKGADLRWSEGGKPRFGKAIQLPILPLIGVGAAGDQHAYFGEEGRKLFDCGFDLRSALVCLWDLVQPVEQEQASGAFRLIAQGFLNVAQCVRERLNDIIPQGIASDFSGLASR